MRRALAMAGLFCIAAGCGPARGADATAGEAVFGRCKVCHMTAAAGRSTVGPNLHGVFGRPAGAVERFNYSPAMKESHVVWTDDTLARFLRDPRGFMPGNRMAFPGIKDDNEMADLLAYMHQAAE